MRWAVRGNDLLEFGPVAGGSSLYLLKNNGAIYAIKRRTGVVYWKKKLGHLAASSPAYANGVLFCTILEGDKGSKKGRVVAFNVEYPKIRWSRTLPSRTETSPIVVDGTLYVGSENGTVYAFDADRRQARAGPTTRRAPSRAASPMTPGSSTSATTADTSRRSTRSNGHKVWAVNGGGGAFGLGGGQFYATPSVAFGRVYLGNTNGSMYSFATANGELAWRRATGNYVYSSAAVASIPGIGPTVYVGSYDGTLYALDARSGEVRWKHRAEGKISGGIQMIGDLVFYSTLNGHTTALGAATGRQVWTVAKGKLQPRHQRRPLSVPQRPDEPVRLRPAAGERPGQDLPGRQPDDPPAGTRPRAPGARARRDDVRVAERLTRQAGAGRTAMPAAARCAFASPIVCWP